MDDPNINAAFIREEQPEVEQPGVDTLDKSHVTDVERGIEAVFDKCITLPITIDGKDSGVAIYVGLTKIGKWAIGPVSDQRIRDIADRISLAGRCLSPPRGLGCAPHDGKAVHAHDDGTWWFWDETWTNEHGPYATEEQAELKIDEYCRTVLASGEAKAIPDDVWAAFHKVWTWCVRKPGYDKAQFMALEGKLFEAARPT